MEASQEKAASDAHFSSLGADLYLQGFASNWLTKQFKARLVLNCFFRTLL